MAVLNALTGRNRRHKESQVPPTVETVKRKNPPHGSVEIFSDPFYKEARPVFGAAAKFTCTIPGHYVIFEALCFLRKTE
jgi:hypothetical protein